MSTPGKDIADDRSWRLPALVGRRGKAVLAIYAFVAAIIFVVIAGSFWVNSRDFFGNMPTAAEYGFRTYSEDGIPKIASVTRREPGRSDLREEDRILAIDGVALSADATEFTIADRLDAVEDGNATIVTRSTDGTVRTHRIERHPITSATMEPSARMPLWLYIAIGFVAGQLPLLVWFGASMVLAWRRPRDSEAMLLAFAFLLLCVTRGSGFWLIAFLDVPSAAIRILENLGGVLMLVAIAAFPDGRFSNAFARLALLLLSLLSILVVVVDVNDLSTNLMNATSILAILAVLASVWTRYRSTSDLTQRQQIKWAVFGFCAAMLMFLPILIATVAGLIPDDGPIPILAYMVFGQFAWLLIPAGLLVSLMRYRLYDADAAISRSAAYAALTLVLAALFAASAEGLEWLLQAGLGREAGALPNVMAAALAVLAFTPLNNRLQLWAEWRFQRDLVRLRRDLPECVADMREISALDRLLQAILERVATGVHAERAAITIGRDVAATLEVGFAETLGWLERAELDAADEALDCDREDDLFPMRVPLKVRFGSDGNFGWLLLGPRPDDSFYGRDEQEALAELADPIARAIQIVLVREAREAEAERHRQGLEQRLAAIEAQLKASDGSRTSLA